MIKNSKPLSLPEVAELAGDSEKEEKIKDFIKKFVKLTAKEAKEMKKELEDLKLIKLKGEHIVKIIDFKPEDISDLNKIMSDVSLEQDEITKILDITKKY